LIATAAGPLVAEPSWTRYDELSACRCGGFDWQRGRQSEFDVTNTGTARVYFHDRNGTFASEDFIGLQIMLQLYDPVAAAWEPVFRGHIDDAHGSPSPGAPTLTNVQLDCVDILDYLAGVKMVVGTFGDVLPAGMDGVVFYEDGPVDGRLDDLASDAGLASSMYVHFTGNVNVHETVYDPDDDILGAMRDAADAEFPLGLANVYCDRYGREVFHGRFAKIDPDTTSSGAEWTFTRWEAATREDVITGRAHIREFQYNRPRARIVNSFAAWPELTQQARDFPPSLIATMTKTDATSISAYGLRGREAPALIIKEHKTNGNTGADECELFGTFYVTNLAEPRKNIERVTFKSYHPDWTGAADTWEILTRMDISDVIHMWVDEAGLTDAEFFIEGISGECRVGTPGYDIVTVTPNLSPAEFYATDIFGAPS
jgi:hypothetical protein